MNIHDTIVIIVAITTFLSAIYRMGIEPSINAKITSLELSINSKIANLTTTSLITIDNLKDNFNDKIIALDRKVDIHLQDYTHNKDAVLLQHNSLHEKINHNWGKTEKLFNSERQK
ncbi:hypothetical protein [Nostoc sp.]|uniref:hypothetical protein n=1 Tax=Nostoc sp. TaxID=1180 RepID=UPI002FF71377